MTIDRILTRGRTLWRRAGDSLFALGIFLAGLFLYLQTLAPSVVAQFDDSLEFQLVAYRLGVAHPTGYPLYTLLAKLFTLGPWRNVAWSVNLLSAVAGALTTALVYLVIRKLSCRRLPAVLGAAALAISPIFWSQSVVAEVYTLSTAFLAGLLFLALRWAQQPLRAVTPFSRLLASPKTAQTQLPASDLAAAEPPPNAADSPAGAPPRPWRLSVHRLAQSAGRLGRRALALYRRLLPVVLPRRRLQPHPMIYVLATAFGLSLTHHRTVMLLTPALLLYVWLVERRILSRAALLGPEQPEQPHWRQLLGRPIVLLAFCFLLPLLLYLYLPIRGHVGSLDGTYVNTWSGFWRWVTAREYNVFWHDNPLARNLDAPFYARLFWQQFGPVGLALALVGLVGLLRRPRPLALTGLAFVAYTGFALAYRVPDVEVYFLPSFLLVAIWLGAGLDYSLDLLRPRGPSLALRRLAALVRLLLVVAAVLQVLVPTLRSYSDLDLSRRWAVHDRGLYFLSEPLPQDSTVVGILGEMSLLRYLQESSGRRRDVETVVADGEVERALEQDRSVYITRQLPGLAGRYPLAAVTGLIDVGGDLQILVQVDRPDDQVPDPPRSVDLEPMRGLRLLGYGLREHQAHWQSWLRLRLWWRAPSGLPEPVKISVRLLDAAGQQVSAVDAEPVGGTYPTTAWRPGEIVIDAYEIPLPSGLPPGEYRSLLILYEPATGQERGRAELGAFALQGNLVRPPQPELRSSVSRIVNARFREVELLGFTPPDSAVPYQGGDSFPVTLLWQAARRPTGQYHVSFWLDGLEDRPLDTLLLGGEYPAERWEASRVVRQALGLQVPQDLAPGRYRLMMRVLRNGRPVPWARGWLPLGSDLELGSLQIGE